MPFQVIYLALSEKNTLYFSTKVGYLFDNQQEPSWYKIHTVRAEVVKHGI